MSVRVRSREKNRVVLTLSKMPTATDGLAMAAQEKAAGNAAFKVRVWGRSAEYLPLSLTTFVFILAQGAPGQAWHPSPGMVVDTAAVAVQHHGSNAVCAECRVNPMLNGGRDISLMRCGTQQSGSQTGGLLGGGTRADCVKAVLCCHYKYGYSRRMY